MTPPSTMRAMQLIGFGDLDQLVLNHVPIPEPAANEIRVHVGACGLNNTDINLRKGWYGVDAESGWKQDATTPFPITQGADIVGRVDALGADVKTHQIGQRVIINPTVYNPNYETNPTQIDYLGSERPGGFAEFVCVPAVNAHAIDSELSDAELATFPTAYLTAEHMLERASVTSGETILVTGASGGVGSALLQLITARGARAIAVVGRGKEDRATNLGAVHVVSRHTENLTADITGFTIDVAADVVGGPQFPQLMEIVRPGGRVVTCGAIASPQVEIDLRTLYLNHITLIGSTLGTQANFARLVRHIEGGTIQPLLAATYPLAALREAQAAFDKKSHFGKIVITTV
ncbi:MAG: zinc-binding dehydrogenase [Chloroflexota bacterium]